MLIGIGHRSGHGKDTFADALIVRLNELLIKAKKVSWAYKGKYDCHLLYSHYGLREPEYYDTDEGRQVRNIPLPGINKTPVEIWIDYMNAIRDHVDPLTWCNYLYESTKEYEGVIVAPDTRLEFELPCCDYLIKVVNPRVPNREGKSIDHILENYDDWHLVIQNDGTKEELCNKAVATGDLIAKIVEMNGGKFTRRKTS